MYSSGPSFATSVIELPNLISGGLTPGNPEKVNAGIPLSGLSFGRVRDMTGEIFEYSEYFALHFENMKRSTALLMNTAEELDEHAGSVRALRSRLQQMAIAERFQVSFLPLRNSHPFDRHSALDLSPFLPWTRRHFKRALLLLRLWYCFMDSILPGIPSPASIRSINLSARSISCTILIQDVSALNDNRLRGFCPSAP